MANRLPLISIVVPIYNTEQYLYRCIESIVIQSFQNIEIILVNDGSIDSSGAICDEWAKKDTRVRVIHKKNEGVTIARKTGVESATGEWICFVDSDDYIPEDAIHTLHSHVRDDVDMVCGSFVYKGNYKLTYNCFGEMDSVRYLKALLNHKVHWGPCCRVIRKTFFDDFTFDMPASITSGEDLIMNLRLVQKMQKIIVLPDIVYYYIYRPRTVMSNEPMINRDFMRIYHETFNKSISVEYRDKAQAAIICFWLFRYWRVFIEKIKLIIKYNRNFY